MLYRYMRNINSVQYYNYYYCYYYYYYHYHYHFIIVIYFYYDIFKFSQSHVLNFLAQTVAPVMLARQTNILLHMFVNM